MANNPPWLRGPVAGVIPMLQPVAHSLVDCREDVEARLAGVAVERIWTKPGNAASVGFHVRHAMGSIERLFTYARGEQLNAGQLAALKTEAARILGCEVDWVGKLCDRGTFVEGADWRRIGVRGNYKIKRASVLRLAGHQIEELTLNQTK